MQSKILTFVVGAACGAVGMFFMSDRGSNDAQPEAHATLTSPQPRNLTNLEPRNPIGRDEDQIARIEKKLADLKAARSIARMGKMGDDDSKSGLFRTFGSDEASQFDFEKTREMERASERSERRENHRAEKIVNSRLATLTSRLSLSEEQVEKVHELLRRDVAAQPGSMEKILRLANKGDLDEGLQSEPETPVYFGTELDALLDDDQTAAYAELIEARFENHIEASANRELAELQTNIPDLTKEQKDNLFNAFARFARSEREPQALPTGDLDFDADFDRIADLVRNSMFGGIDAKHQEVNDILTPEQAALYKVVDRNLFTIDGVTGQIITRGIVIDPEKRGAQ